MTGKRFAWFVVGVVLGVMAYDVMAAKLGVRDDFTGGGWSTFAWFLGVLFCWMTGRLLEEVVCGKRQEEAGTK